MPAAEFIDLHCHPLPGIDDGVRSAADGGSLLAGLAGIGFARVVATPHVRSGIWDNRPETIAPATQELRGALAELVARGKSLPVLDVAAEHLFDDVTWELFSRGAAMLYPAGRAALIEFPYDSIPIRVEARLWRLARNGVTPVLAHPERYAPLFRSSDRLEEIVAAGTWPLLDVMSLVGVYGTAARGAAFRMLEQGLYRAACTDAHKPSDVPVVAQAIEVLRRTVGDDGLRELLVLGPAQLLAPRTG